MTDEFPTFSFNQRRWTRWLTIAGVLAGVALIAFVMTFKLFFKYVPPGHMLVLTAQDGDPLPPGQVLAEPKQKGVLREVKGEGYHFVLPIVYSADTKAEVTVIPAGKVGIVTALGGVAPRDGRVLAEQDDEQGIRRPVLPPGAYRINPHGFKVEQVAAVEIKPGYVGLKRRLLGKEGKGRFASPNSEEKGFVREVLQPGLYYINTKEFEVLEEEVGIEQTSYRYDTDKTKDTSISFSANDGFTIRLECTIEWELLPTNIPDIIAEFGDWHVVEKNVIDLYTSTIISDRGLNYGVEDFLDGTKREKFQADFAHELERACKAKNVNVRSAFIRNIIIPESYLRQKRDNQIALETRITSEVKQVTAQSDSEVEREKRMIEQRVLKVQAETTSLVAQIDQDVENAGKLADAEIEKLKAEYGAKIAELDAQRRRIAGESEATVKQLKETATNGIYKLRMELFGSDTEAFLRATLADKLNPKVAIRLFQSGPGTFWTNMDGKGPQIMLTPTTDKK